jgi:glycosyltransferase involved in cell wall biosynthesis
MNDPFFSIIVPSYNVERYLEEAVESVEKQNFSDYEIILVDDGATDNTGSLCDELANKNSKIRVIHQKNAGLSEARNSGMKIAKGRYFILLDADDKLSNDSMKNLQKAIEDQSFPDFVVSRRESFEDGCDEVKPCAYTFDIPRLSGMKTSAIYSEIEEYSDCWLGAWIFTISKKYFERAGLKFYPGILHEDEEWVPRVFFNTDDIGFNNSPLYQNRTERAGSITATKNIKRLQDKLLILDLLEKEFNSSRYTADIRETIHKRSASMLFGITKDLYKYKGADKYILVKRDVRKRADLLRSAHIAKYYPFYFIMKIAGPEACSRIIDKVTSKR